MKSKYWKLISLTVVAGIALCIAAVATTLTEQAEKKLSIGEMPEAVKTTILAEAKGRTIEDIETEIEDGRTIYEAEVIIDGQETDIKVATDGTLLGKEVEDEDDDEDMDDVDDEEDEDDEQQVSIDQVPAAVKATILAEAKGKTIEEFVTETEDGRTIYEAEVIIDGQETDIKVAADGTLLGKEVENEDDDDD